MDRAFPIQVQLAAIVTATSLLGGAAAGLLGQNALAATNQLAESIIKCNTPDLPCTRPCRRPMGTRYQHLSAEERATIMIMLQ
ncbi:hypothetical protein, partial [Burkholderia multivorans]|uniref:hypothetical protein n=1 Tax=Burkholderia multivorans TaxID=87883 RepID=UPI0020B450D9